MRKTAFILSTATLAACNAEQYEPIFVAVYPSTKACTIKDVPVHCDTIGQYLRDKLKVGASREIVVSFAGSETIAKDDTSIDQIAELIKKSGYKNARAARYDMK